jgi:tetratricopeptide (TPR) repeat protein
MMSRNIAFIAALAIGAAFGADTQRGKQLFNEGKYAEAEAELRKVVSEHGDDVEARRYLGLALIEQNRASDAAPFIEKAAESDPSGENKIALARLHVARKEYDKAEEALKDAEGSDLEYVRGLVHLNRDNYEAAARDFEAYLEKNPEHAYAHYYAGLAYNGMKRPDKMLSHFQTFVSKKPDAPEARKVRAVLKTGR